MSPTLPRLAYLGSPDMAVPPLAALVDAGFDVPIVVTNPDRRRGRGKAVTPTPVKAEALRHGLTVTHDIEDVLDADVDLGVIVAFGAIVRPHILAAVPMVNLHFSLLPRWRGAAPVERAILAGDTETGVDLMVVEEGLDTGGIYARRRIEIGIEDTADHLRQRLVAAGTDLLVDSLQSGLPEPEPQVGDATYAAKLSSADLQIDWDDPPEVTLGRVRVGGAWTTLAGDRFKIATARQIAGPEAADEGIAHPAGDGWIELIEVQPANKAAMPARSWANGARWTADDRLGS